MTREMARGIGQHFVDAHLIECATDLGSSNFRDRGIYMITSKGLHILERFITKNGIASDHLLSVFSSQPICMKLLHLERRQQDDEILVTKNIFEVLFKRFVGKAPNVTRLSDEVLYEQYFYRAHSKGAPPADAPDRTLGIVVRVKDREFQFNAMMAIDWLLDFTTVIGIEEASEVLAHFVRYGFIQLVHDRTRARDHSVVVTVRDGGAGGGAGALMVEGEYRASEKATYCVTKLGQDVARWHVPPASAAGTGASGSKAQSQVTLSSMSQSPDPAGGAAGGSGAQGSGSRPLNVAEFLAEKPTPAAAAAAAAAAGAGAGAGTPEPHPPKQITMSKDSHTARLKQILQEPALRSLFREYLRSNFCEENLSFWLDVEDFKRRFNKSSSAAAAAASTAASAAASANGSPQPGSGSSQQPQHPSHGAMEKHENDLILLTFVIYNTYLIPAAPSELNLDHQIRAELINYMNEILHSSPGGGSRQTQTGADGHSVPAKLHAKELQNLVYLYERIQYHIFKLMAMDSVPKFIKTERFLNLVKNLNQLEFAEYDAAGGKDADDDKSRTYLTVSGAANQQHAQQQQQQLAQQQLAQHAQQHP